MKDEIKILLLGTGESGKSTVFKQLKLMQSKGKLPDEELKRWIGVVHSNCVTQMKVILNEAEFRKIRMVSEENRIRAENFLKLSFEWKWDEELANDIQSLWRDEGVQELFKKRNSFQLNDSAQYFFDSIERYKSPNFLPTIEDVLRVTARSTGIDEENITVDDTRFRIVDVGGQKPERRKWIKCFTDVSAVMFCASLSEYDQKLREDPTTNRMLESLDLFGEMCKLPNFAHVAMILFLNKKDLFEIKIKEVNLQETFPMYTGGPIYNAGLEFIKARYVEKSKLGPFTEIYIHVTCALERDLMQLVFRAVKETILKQILSITNLTV